MTEETKRRMHNAMTTAAAHLLSMRDIGIEEEDYINFGENSEEGMEKYYKACDSAAKQIFTLAKKYE